VSDLRDDSLAIPFRGTRSISIAADGFRLDVGDGALGVGRLPLEGVVESGAEVDRGSSS
jgi:hypothetical protein